MCKCAISMPHYISVTVHVLGCVSLCKLVYPCKLALLVARLHGPILSVVLAHVTQDGGGDHCLHCLNSFL